MTIEHNAFFIGGDWVSPSSSKRFTLINASTEEAIGSVPEGVEADIDRAVAAARKAFDGSGWSDIAPAERAAAMLRFADAIEKRSATLAQTVTLQNGMPIALSQAFEGGFAVGMLRYYADLANSLPVEDQRPSQLGKETRVRRSPIGVVGAIVPWNYPVVLAMSKIAPALAAGCTLVMKPSPNTVLDSYILAEAALEAGLPPGVINWVAADRTAGAHLVAHPDVDKVSFTGSTAAGRAIGRVCGELLRPVSLELGGKSAAIVLDDVDLGAIMPSLQFVNFMNQGQTCVTCSRLLAPQSRYKEVVEAVAAMASSMKVGNPLEASTEIGPMATAEHRSKVEGYIAKGKAEATLVAGGGRPKGLERGWFVEPTVFADMSNSATIAREEIFGPVLSVIPYKDDADAVRMANDSIYGLGGSVFSADPERAMAVARRVHTGTIGINGYPVAIGSPFGGVKASGIGREFGPEAMQGYQQLKSIYVAG
ncbi:aldehyde dehydrogenase [Ottowia sp.]|jgi:geranial dehydrogenase|uniref:aldehyde dehydrogenase n=1 Tax=Ottowia sp. TaxID=1898956 RepID=UPI0025F00107|nr:aldehyde dehydrogenase [Ottowia sp.]MBK6613893.1 aldehyde dehydrogenase [Ottowia sp.]MBK6745545.1 aldehyde dehydrogenase [Ottowia sp.]